MVIRQSLGVLFSEFSNDVGEREMSMQVPPDLDPAVRRLISEGRFRDESEIVAEGIRLVLKRDQLEKDIQEGLNALDAGNRIPASDVYAEARRRVAAVVDEQRR